MTALVIDIGSSSVRVLLFDSACQPIPGAQASHVYSLNTTPAGAATLDAETLRTQIESCIDTVLQHSAAGDIQVVGLATLSGNVLGVDAAGKVLTPIFTYADTRCNEDVIALTEVLDIESLHQRTGCRLHTAYQPARLRWLMRTEPELFGQVAQWIDLGTYLYRLWFGEAACSYSIASWSGMFNRASLDWNARILEALELTPSRLPELADYSDTRQGLHQDYASRWPALRDVPFCLAVGDGAAANIGSGCYNESQIALTVGTTAALRVVSGDILPRVPEGLWGYRLDAANHLMGGATSEGGNIFEWAQGVLRLEDDPETALLNRPVDAHGLTFLPLLAGERSPGWASDATGTIVGLRISTTPLDILQAALEGVALRLALIAEELGQLAADDAIFVAGGGALHASPAWAQIIADALERPLHIVASSEVTARGAALLAYHAIGLCELGDFPPTMARVVEPRPDAVEILRFARERQVELYERMMGDF